MFWFCRLATLLLRIAMDAWVNYNFYNWRFLHIIFDCLNDLVVFSIVVRMQKVVVNLTYKINTYCGSFVLKSHRESCLINPTERRRWQISQTCRILLFFRAHSHLFTDLFYLLCCLFWLSFRILYHFLHTQCECMSRSLKVPGKW